MSLFYTSTRDNSLKVTASQAVLQGLSADGGLFVPSEIPALPSPVEAYKDMDYKQTALDIMKEFLTDYTIEELSDCIEKAYDSKFDTAEIAPVAAKACGGYVLELFHGKTIAFKDMALSILPHLMTVAAKKQKEDKEIVIMTATSGDTGKAALASFADVPGTKIIVFYPKYGVAPIQEKQMVTQKGDNTCVVGITGNFDDAQTGVKNMFNNGALIESMGKAGKRFSSANSINIGRLVPQVVYYVYAYGRLLKQGVLKANEPMNVVVPTGNFGNILAAFYAKKMGLPIGKLICASNSNNVLFDFFQKGIYDKKRQFHITMSPSMDILVSSNLERLIYYICDCDSETNASLMKQLSEKGEYEITEDMRKKLDDFVGIYATEEQTSETIGRAYHEDSYLMDPHTAVAAFACESYQRDTGDRKPCVIASTASPFKFPMAVGESIAKGDVDFSKEFEKIKENSTPENEEILLDECIAQTAGLKLPEAVIELKTAKVLHDIVCETKDMQKEVEKFLGL